MLPQYPWNRPATRKAEKAGLVSIGSLEDKLPFVLYPILSSVDIALCAYKNFHYPQNISLQLIKDIKESIYKAKLRSVVIDLRIQNWRNSHLLRHSRTLTRSLQDFCQDFSIVSSIFLSNGGQFIGNTVGPFHEMIEASRVPKGEGPSDLTKFALEIAAEFLVASKKAPHRRDAKTWLRDKIFKGNLSETGTEILSPSLSPTVLIEKIKFSSHKPGYIHHLDIKELHKIRSVLAAANHRIGFSLIKKAGDRIEPGDDIIDVYLPEGQQNPLDESSYQRALVTSSVPPEHQPLILERIESPIHPK